MKDVAEKTDIKLKDKEFLEQLNKKLHIINESTFTPNMYGKSFPICYDTYTDKKLNEEELSRVLKISQKINYVILPINTSLGFSVGYEIAEIIPKRKRDILKFAESQLPEGWNFQKMSEFFMKNTNRIKALILKEEIVNDYGHYDY